MSLEEALKSQIPHCCFAPSSAKDPSWETRFTGQFLHSLTEYSSHLYIWFNRQVGAHFSLPLTCRFRGSLNGRTSNRRKSRTPSTKLLKCVWSKADWPSLLTLPRQFHDTEFQFDLNSILNWLICYPNAGRNRLRLCEHTRRPRMLSQCTARHWIRSGSHPPTIWCPSIVSFEIRFWNWRYSIDWSFIVRQIIDCFHCFRTLFGRPRCCNGRTGGCIPQCDCLCQHGSGIQNLARFAQFNGKGYKEKSGFRDELITKEMLQARLELATSA